MSKIGKPLRRITIEPRRAPAPEPKREAPTPKREKPKREKVPA